MVKSVYTLLFISLLFPFVFSATCGDGICSPEESCSSCSVDCGPCVACTEKWFCSGNTTLGHQDESCKRTFYSCDPGYQCSTGQCIQQEEVEKQEEIEDEQKDITLIIFSIAVIAAVLGVTTYFLIKNT